MTGAAITITPIESEEDLDAALIVMTGMTRYEVSRCAYDPARRETREEIGAGCQNEVAVSLGNRDQWRLCTECAERPEFKRFKTRRPFLI